MMQLGFPTGVLFDMLMRGGPLPDRHEHLRGALVNAGPLDFSAEEAVVIREWLKIQSDDVLDAEARDTAIETVDRALRADGACLVCGGPFIVDDREGQPRCGRCGEIHD